MEKNHSNRWDLAVIGGGAAGFFGAIRAAELRPGLRVIILEKSNKILAKVKISGGGRCNVTHDCLDAIALSRHYPRGEKSIRSIFKQFAVSDVIKWFESRGVSLKTEEDGRMFPVSDNSQTIIDCFVNEAIARRIRIEMGEGVTRIERTADLFTLTSASGKIFESRSVLIATGGNPNEASYHWLKELGHSIVPPIPSLFTFNDPEKKFADLMGVSVPSARVVIAGTKLSQEGPLLITHWGLSGPAVIKLSAWAATFLHELNYQFTALVSWSGHTEEEARKAFASQRETGGRQKVVSNPLFGLPQRLWIRLCTLADIAEKKIWAELSQKNQNKLMELVVRCPFHIKGKTTFKEEFVTCGGVDLKDVDLSTMQSLKVPGVYFSGEVLNIDGETGGFNFQSAWSTANLAASSLIRSL